jgi:hypothetical protein
MLANKKQADVVPGSERMQKQEQLSRRDLFVHSN